MVAGEVAIARPAARHQVVEGAVRGWPARCFPTTRRSHPYKAPASVSVTITNDDPALSLALVGGGEQQQRQMEDGVECTGKDSRAPPRGELPHEKASSPASRS